MNFNVLFSSENLIKKRKGITLYQKDAVVGCMKLSANVTTTISPSQNSFSYDMM